MGYIYALVAYLKTDKGRHDFLDYGRAILIMIAVMLVVRLLVEVIV